MSLSPGSQLGSYEVLSPLGAGGMGEVWKARDTKLKRDVAIKGLPDAFANDPDRLRRFRREAEVLASLNQPNIAAIYGLEESAGSSFLILELVDGETLGEILNRGPLPLEEALNIGVQICAALEVAHEKSIIHRDLKPANIKITPEGTVKLLDFGLARILEPDPAAEDASNSPTIMSRTGGGAILGTAAYMSPEQARGKTVDRRADIWAFGVVMYEMLTASQAFGGETVSDSVARILKEEPQWDALPAAMPHKLRDLLVRCLQKDPRLRLHDIADARIEIGEVQSQPVRTEAASRSSRSAVLLGVIALLSLAIAGLLWRSAAQTPSGESWSGTLLGGPEVAYSPRISPDGRTLAFEAMVDNLSQVAVMNPDSGNWTVLTKDRSRGFVLTICWSRDGSKIYFDRNDGSPRGVFSVPALGGEERLVLEDAGNPEVLRDGSLAVNMINAQRLTQIYHFTPQTRELKPLAAFSRNFFDVLQASADGREVYFFGKSAERVESDSEERLYALDVAANQARRLAVNLTLGQGRPIAIDPSHQSILTVTDFGDLRQIVAINPKDPGKVHPMMTLTLPAYYLDGAADGSIYLDQIDRPSQVLVFPAIGGTPERLAETVSPGNTLGVRELPDGRVLLPTRISGRGRLMVITPGKTSAPLIDTDEETDGPAAVLADREVAFMIGSGADRAIAIASIADGRIARRLKGASGTGIQALAASPDGKTLFYVASRNVWSIPAADGSPYKIGAGDSIAVDPNGIDLIVQLNEREIHLARLPVSGGEPRVIPFHSDLRLTTDALAQNAVRQDGKILFSASSKDSWFFSAAVLDTKTGKVEKVPLTFTGDVFFPGWSRDGRIIASGRPLKSSMWRFRPIAAKR